MFVVVLHTENGLALDAREVTLTWTDSSNVKQSASSLTDGLGVATFVVTVPAGGVEFVANVDGLQSNSAYLTGTTLTP